MMIRRLVRPWFSWVTAAAVLSSSLVHPGSAAAREFPAGVWTESTYTAVFKDSLPSADASTTIQLDLARNDFEAGQIVVRRPTGYRINGVTFTDLTGPAGTLAKANLSYNYVGYDYLNANTPDIYPTVRTGAGDYPDRLLNDAAIDVPAGRTQSVWVRVHTPAGTAPGIYTGRAELNTSAGVIQVQVSANVRDVVIPPSSQGAFTTALWQLFTGTISWVDEGDHMEKFYGFPRYSPQWWELMEDVAKKMRQYRTNDLAIPVVRHLLDAGSRRNPDGSYQLNWEKFDQVVQFMIDRGAVKRLEGFWEGGRRPEINGNWGVEAVDAAGNRTWLTWDSAEGQNWLNRFIPALRDHIRAKGWESIFWTHIGDEPTDTVAQWRGVATSVRRNWPNVKLGDAFFQFASHQQLIDQLDLVVPQTDLYDGHREYYDQKKAEGKELWWYNSTAPRRNYLNRFVDQPYWHQRLQGWSAYGRGVTGYLHWAMSHWNMPMNDQDAKGDHYIVRPDRERRLVEVSPRYESLRDGVEDYEVLNVLSKTDPGLARGLAQSLVERNDKYTPDISYMQRIRALALDAASQKPTTDLARSAATTASAGDGAAAVDGNAATAWQPGSGAQWLRVDLGRQAQIDGIKLRWNTAGVGYKIQVSYDGVRWTEVTAVGASDGGTDFAGVNGKARYVRVEVTAGSAALADLQVAGAVLAKANLAGGRTYSLSPAPNSTPDSGIESTDGVLADAWDDGRSYGYQAPAGTVDVTIDLGSIQAVDSAAVHAYEEYPGYRPDAVRVATSVNGTTFDQRGLLAAPRGPSGVWYAFQFPKTQARYVRITFTKSYAATADRLFVDEIEVYAADSRANHAAGKPYLASHPAPADAAYPDTGDKESTDGVAAGGFGDGHSYGYRLASAGASMTLDILVDLGSSRQLNRVRVARYHDGTHDYDPDSVQVFAGDNPVALPLLAQSSTPDDRWFDLAAPASGRFVKVRLTKARTHDFADYLFVDEIHVLDPGGSNLALNQPYLKSRPAAFDPAYPDTGGRESTDGRVAGGYADGLGYGFRLASPSQTVTVDLLVDLASSSAISSVWLQQFDDAVHHYSPDRVDIWTGDSPVAMVGRGGTGTPADGWYHVAFAPTSGRYVRIRATKTRTDDFADHLFLDETMIG